MSEKVAKKESAAEVDPSLSLMGEMLKTMQKMQSSAAKEPALPTPGLFEAGKDYVVVRSDGLRARHGDKPDGKATVLDEDGKPALDGEGNPVEI